jgi:hypothetical protein
MCFDLLIRQSTGVLDRLCFALHDLFRITIFFYIIRRFPMKRFIILIIFILILAPAAWSMNPVINIQGVLRDNGAPMADGTYELKFKLYEQETGGTAVWTETQPNVQVANGMFSVDLGSVNNFSGVPFDVPYYLGISVGSNAELSPRTRLNSSVYAISLAGGSNQFPSSGNVTINADIHVESITFPDGSSINSFPPKMNHLDTPSGDTQNAVYVDDTGQVGINTGIDPTAKLEVDGNVKTGNMTILGDLETDTLKVNNTLSIKNLVPIVVKSYDVSINDSHAQLLLPENDHPPTDWVACIAGFDANEGDWDEDSIRDLFQVRMAKNTSQTAWIILVDLISDDDHCSWTVDVMFIRKELVNTNP